MKKVALLLLAAPILGGWYACSENNDPSEDIVTEAPVIDETSDEEVQIETWIADIELNDSLTIGNSLLYIKENGESVEVEMFINDSSEMVKLVERYTKEGSYTLYRRIFYLKDGQKFATRELYEDSLNGELNFIERVSYYDEKEAPVLSKRRVAMYEEELDYEAYTIIDNYDCKMDRAIRVLQQEEEFATTFQGFVQEAGTRYILVGENKPDAYTSTLLVQFFDATINELYQNESAMIGKPLKLNFEKLDDGRGFEYQLLLGVSID